MLRSFPAAQAVSLVCLFSAGCLFNFDRTLSPGEITGEAVYRSSTGALVPAAGATVTLENSLLSVTADSHGSFVLIGLPTGTFAVDVTASPGGLTSGEVGLRLTGLTIATGDGLDLGQIELVSFGGIRGTVTVDGAAVGQGAVATITGLAQAPVADGAFQFPELLAGTYQVTVVVPENPGALVSQPLSVQVSPAATAQPSIALSSQADLQMSGAVQGQVQVSGATSNGGVDVQFSGNGPDLTSSASGSYASGGVPATVYTVTASLGGFGSVSVPGVPVGVGTTVVPTITLFAVSSVPVDAGAIDGGGQPECLVDSECPAGEVCLAGSCGIAVDGGPVDAGPDGGPSDGGPSEDGGPDSGVEDGGRPDAGPPDAGPPLAPAGLTYATNPAVYVTGFTIADDIPSSTGGAVMTYSVQPPLPPGISVDPQTGIISGAPTAASPATSYTITAQNSAGMTSATLTITVNATVTGMNGALAAGGYHACAIVNGGVECWGDNADGQLGNDSTINSLVPTPVQQLPLGVQALGAGSHGFSTCAIVGGGAWCWGYNDDGELGNNSTVDSPVPVQVTALTSGVQSLVAGQYHSCALVNGGVVCWGGNIFGELGNNSTTGSLTPVMVEGLTSGVQGIAAGALHMCAIVDGSVWCWGDDVDGQLGNNSTTSSPVPAQAVNLTGGVQAIAAGDNHTCAVVNGGVWCWGNNADGQLGNGGTANSLVPVPSLLSSGVQAIAAGSVHTCAVVNGAAECWGDNVDGQLGNNTTATSMPTPVTVLTGGVQALALGELSSCALVSGGLQCWGSGNTGTLGNNSTANSSVPVQVSGLAGGVQALAGGGECTCAIVNGGVQCWGEDSAGELGNNAPTGSNLVVPEPVAVFGLTSGAQAIAGDNEHVCAIVNGGVQCWGYNAAGELGNNSGVDSSVPVAVTGIAGGAEAIAAGWEHTCAVVNGGAWCWGDNQYGELGNNSTVPSPVPVPVVGLSSDVQSVVAADMYSCALVNGGVWCWGDGQLSELGDNATVTSLVPVQVSGLTSGVQAITAGEVSDTTCALVNGGVQCWGSNSGDGLGNNSTVFGSSVPVQVAGLTSGVQGVSFGGNTGCALVGGGLQCWGDDDNGQLGNNSTTNTGVPGSVPGLTGGVQAIAVNELSTCAVQSGAVFCWGDNQQGELGNNSTTGSPVGVPVAVGPWAQ